MAQKKKRDNPAAHVAAEKVALIRLYPNGTFSSIKITEFNWESDIVPTPLSNSYRIKISYKYGRPPHIYVIDPNPLKKYPGQNSLPHVYSTFEQRICLYYPGVGEWTKDKLIARTIVPWAAEWLQFYELWLATGTWYGEGVHPKDSKNKKDNIDE